MRRFNYISIVLSLMVGLVGSQSLAADHSSVTISVHGKKAVIAHHEYLIDNKDAMVQAIRLQCRTHSSFRKVSIQPTQETKDADLVKLMDAAHHAGIRKVKFLNSK